MRDSGRGRALDGAALRDWAHRCVEDLITRVDEINRLNVFPVPDADTGTNMLFTMRSAVAQLESEPALTDAGAVALALSAGAHTGARGNSGVILSQILRGIADGAAGIGRREIDTPTLAAGLSRGVHLIIASMGDDVPGTMTSVLRAAADAVSARAADSLPAALAAASEAAGAALDKTPEQLDVLAAAGAVDAGGRGLLILIDALCATITGYAPARPVYRLSPRAIGAVGPGTGRAEVPERRAPQFEVMYLLAAPDLAAVEVLRARLDQLGDSVAVAYAPGDGADHSVHVHTDDAGAAVEAGLAAGSLSRIVISSLQGGRSGLPSGSWTRERAVLAVVDGEGAFELFAVEGADVLRPSAEAEDPAAGINAHQLTRAVVDTGAAQVMVLPNGFVPAAELVAGCTAAIGWGVDVVPIPAASMVQGLAALAVHDPARPAVDDGYTMAGAAGAARHGSVRIATESALTWAGPCQPGDGLGIAGDEVLIVATDPAAAAIGLIDLLLASGGELVTVLIGDHLDDGAGADLETLLQAHIHDHHAGSELVVYRTGHRGDVLLIGVE